MAKKQNGIPCDVELAEKLRFLSDNTKKPQIAILREIIERMALIGSSLDGFTYMVFDRGQTITIQFYGKPKLISGKVVMQDLTRIPCDKVESAHEDTVLKKELAKKVKTE